MNKTTLPCILQTININLLAIITIFYLKIRKKSISQNGNAFLTINLNLKL